MNIGRAQQMTLGQHIESDKNRERYFWQCRSGLLIELMDLRDLARGIRRTWP